MRAHLFRILNVFPPAGERAVPSEAPWEGAGGGDGGANAVAHLHKRSTAHSPAFPAAPEHSKFTSVHTLDLSLYLVSGSLPKVHWVFNFFIGQTFLLAVGSFGAEERKEEKKSIRRGRFQREAQSSRQGSALSFLRLVQSSHLVVREFGIFTGAGVGRVYAFFSSVCVFAVVRATAIEGDSGIGQGLRAWCMRLQCHESPPAASSLDHLSPLPFPTSSSSY